MLTRWYDTITIKFCQGVLHIFGMCFFTSRISSKWPVAYRDNKIHTNAKRTPDRSRGFFLCSVYPTFGCAEVDEIRFLTALTAVISPCGKSESICAIHPSHNKRPRAVARGLLLCWRLPLVPVPLVVAPHRRYPWFRFATTGKCLSAFASFSV